MRIMLLAAVTAALLFSFGCDKKEPAAEGGAAKTTEKADKAQAAEKADKGEKADKKVEAKVEKKAEAEAAVKKAPAADKKAIPATAAPEKAGEAKKEEAVAEKKDAGANPIVVIKTSMGVIEAELFTEKAPISVKNFLQYVDDGFYAGTIFHRVIDNFMIQGGGFTADYKKKPTREPIKNEAGNGLKNRKYTLAMARTSVVDSATAQFFINVKDNGFLDHRSPDPRGFGYAVFGKVVSGMDVVDEIKKTPTGPGGPFRKDAPQTPVVIESITRK